MEELQNRQKKLYDLRPLRVFVGFFSQLSRGQVTAVQLNFYEFISFEHRCFRQNVGRHRKGTECMPIYLLGCKNEDWIFINSRPHLLSRLL